MSSFATLAPTANYLALLQQLSDRDLELSKALDPAYTAVTAPPTNMVRFSSANFRWETYNGSSWVELVVAASSAFAMTVTGLRGGNIYGAVTNNGSITGGTVNAATLQAAGSAAWTAATLTNLNQLINGPAFITAAALSPYSTLASPAFSGTPTAPTPAVDTGTAQLANTLFVLNQGYLKVTSAASTYLPKTGGILAGDITTYRPASPRTGVIFLGANNETTYLYYDGGTFILLGGQLDINNQRALNAGNFNAYAPTLTGAGASGSWPINAATTSQTSWASLTTTTRLTAMGGQTGGMAVGTDALGGIMVSSAGTGAAFMSFHRPGYYGTYFGLDTDNQWKVGGWSAGAVAYALLHAGNFNAYAPTLTGGNASGTWNISITGNAANAATQSQSATGAGANAFFNNTPASGRHWGEINSVADTPNTGWWMLENMRHFNAAGVWGVQYAHGWESNANELYRRNVSSGVWSGWFRFLHSGNYNQYAPTLTGGNASGTWNINITGGAGTAGNSNTTSQRRFDRVRTDTVDRGNYGSISIAGSNNAWGGIDFTDYAATLMVNGTVSGLFRNNNVWDWSFNSGVLTEGWVPWGRVTGKPVTTVTTSTATPSGGSPGDIVFGY